MTRHKPIDTSPRCIAAELERQLRPGTFEPALSYLVDLRLDLSRIDARYRNDLTGAGAYRCARTNLLPMFPAVQGLRQCINLNARTQGFYACDDLPKLLRVFVAL